MIGVKIENIKKEKMKKMEEKENNNNGGKINKGVMAPPKMMGSL